MAGVVHLRFDPVVDAGPACAGRGLFQWVFCRGNAPWFAGEPGGRTKHKSQIRSKLVGGPQWGEPVAKKDRSPSGLAGSQNQSPPGRQPLVDATCKRELDACFAADQGILLANGLVSNQIGRA